MVVQAPSVPPRRSVMSRKQRLETRFGHGNMKSFTAGCRCHRCWGALNAWHEQTEGLRPEARRELNRLYRVWEEQLRIAEKEAKELERREGYPAPGRRRRGKRY
jgi:hypothetical protein